jgi:methylated-DNA-[protein]-cysteine S-methyltransferase
MTDLTRHTVDTPLGTFEVWVADDVVHAAGFAVPPGKKSALDNLPERGAGRRIDAGPARHPALDAVQEYFAGDLDRLGRVALSLPPTTAFRAAARSALIGIGPAEIRTYTELATTAGNPRAVRAAANVCATNPIALFVPCHRVLRSDGSLGGFLYGLDVKRALLDHEAKFTAGSSPAAAPAARPE